MKRFVLKCILLFFLCFTTFYFRIDYNSKRAHPNSYFFAHVDKIEILKASLQNPSQRIIFLGGSNLAFGLDSELIEKSLENILNTDITVINMGLHAGIGLNRLINQILPYLREQDIVILVPEYGQFSKQINGFGTAWFLERDILHTPLLKMRKRGFLTFPTEFLSYLKETFKKPVGGTTDTASAYRRDAFNSYGDLIGHLSLSHDEPITPFTAIPEYDIRSIKAFMRYVKLMQNKNVTILFSYPCFQEQSFYNNENIIEETDKFLRKRNPYIIFLGEPRKYIVNDSLLYDTPFHLNADGREKRTLLVIEDLIAYFKGTGN